MNNLILPLSIKNQTNDDWIKFGSAPEDLIKIEATNHAALYFAQAFAGDKFEIEGLLKNLVNYSNRAASELFPDAVETYLDRQFYNPNPLLIDHAVDNDLTKFITENFSKRVTAQDLQGLRVSKEFSRSIKLTLGKRGLDFSHLELIHQRSLAETEIPRLLREILSFYDTKTHEIDAANAFKIIKQARDENWKVAIKLGTSEDLYFLTFLPNNIRYVVQDLIITKTMKQVFDQLKPDSNTYEDSIIFGELNKYLHAGIFANRHWDDLFKFVTQEFNENSEFIDECSKREISLRSLLSNPNRSFASQVITRYFEKGREIFQKLLQIDKDSIVKKWMTIDIGHAFSNILYDFSLLKIVDGDSFAPNYQKSSDYAVILEDDSKQLRQWSQLVSELSRYNLVPDGSSLCSNPTQILQHISNPECKLFLIDLQNGDDNFAGLKVAENIIQVAKARIERGEFKLKENADYSDSVNRLVTIIIFSHSDEFLAICDQHFKQKTTSLPNQDISANFVSYNLLNLQSGNGPIHLALMSKRSYLLARAIMEG